MSGYGRISPELHELRSIKEKVTPLELLAKESKRQSEATIQHVEVLKKQVEILESEANRAKHEAEEAKRDSRFSKIVSVLAVFSPILWDLVKTYFPTIFRPFLEYLQKF